MNPIQHTPKPWKIGTRKDGSRWFSLGNPSTGPHYQADVHCSDADAALIAAAPDLLEALLMVRAKMNDWNQKGPTIRQIDAALSKAQGTQS